MALHIIIDGYNLIRCSPRLASYDRQDIETGRNMLIDHLVVYKRLKKHEITIVFDGGGSGGITQREDRIKGILVRFSPPGETADNLIKRMAATEREKALIVTSDRDILDYAQSKGASVVTSPAFEEKVQMARYVDTKGLNPESECNGWKPTTRKKGPSRRASKRKRRLLRKVDKL
ncbi:MAG: hypothetical protein HKM93_01855 [Desulfobacteraceae bacterium]|nr:hypothetical protein [Desulfobacteraceae bacterium]